MRGETSSRGQNQNSWLGVTPLHILWLGCRFTLKLCASRLRSVPVQCWRPGHVWRKGCNQRPPHVCALLLFGKKTPTLSFLYFILLSVCIYFPEWGNPSFPPMHSFCLLQVSMCAQKKPTPGWNQIFVSPPKATTTQCGLLRTTWGFPVFAVHLFFLLTITKSSI